MVRFPGHFCEGCSRESLNRHVSALKLVFCFRKDIIEELRIIEIHKEQFCGRLMSARIVTLITQIMVMAVVISVILLFLGIGILVSIHLCIVGRALRRNLNGRRPAERGVASSSSVSGNGGGMSQEEVQKLPCFEYKHGGMYIVLDGILCKDDDSATNINCLDRIENGLWVDEFDCSECAVCLDGFQKGEKCRILPVCRHTFHAKCVDSWLYKNPLCPICRARAEQHGKGGGKLGIENVLDLTRVGDCEMVSGPSDIAIGVSLQGGVGRGWESAFHRMSEMSNSVSNPPPSPRSPPIDEFELNLLSTPSFPSWLQHRPNDDGNNCCGGLRGIDALSTSQSQSQYQNQYSGNLISSPVPSCTPNGDDDVDDTRGIGVLSPSQNQSQNQNQNSCDSVSIPPPSCRPPHDDGVRVAGLSITSQSQYQNRIVCNLTLTPMSHCRSPDDEDVRITGVTYPNKSRSQIETPDQDAPA